MHPVRRTSLALLVLLFPITLLAQPITLRVEDPFAPPDGSSATPAVSANGRVVVFHSTAGNFVPGNANDGSLFSYDLLSQTIGALVPGANAKAFDPAVSADGRFVAFHSGATNLTGSPGTPRSGGGDVYRVDRSTGQVRQVSLGLGGVAASAGSSTAAISGDGRHVAFSTAANNLVAGGTTVRRVHLYITDVDTGTTELVTRAPNGAEGNADSYALENGAMSSDGRSLVFQSEATNLAPVTLGNNYDVFVRRKQLDGTVTFEMVNRSVAGVLGNSTSGRGSISPNGRYVVFRSGATNIVSTARQSGLFVRDLSANTLREVPRPSGFGDCLRGRVDDNGRVLMQCAPIAPATAIQLFVAPHGAGAPRLVSGGLGGVMGNASSNEGFSIDGAGELIAFGSAATNLVQDDTNVASDVFLHAEPPVFDRLFRDGLE